MNIKKYVCVKNRKCFTGIEKEPFYSNKGERCPECGGRVRLWKESDIMPEPQRGIWEEAL